MIFGDTGVENLSQSRSLSIFFIWRETSFYPAERVVMTYKYRDHNHLRGK
jgi:hypothetical protein